MTRLRLSYGGHRPPHGQRQKKQDKLITSLEFNYQSFLNLSTVLPFPNRIRLDDHFEIVAGKVFADGLIPAIPSKGIVKVGTKVTIANLDPRRRRP